MIWQILPIFDFFIKSKISEIDHFLTQQLLQTAQWRSITMCLIFYGARKELLQESELALKELSFWTEKVFLVFIICHGFA